MSTESIAMGNADGSKATVADDKGQTQTIASAGWQDTKEAQERTNNGKQK